MAFYTNNAMWKSVDAFDDLQSLKAAVMIQDLIGIFLYFSMVVTLFRIRQ